MLEELCLVLKKRRLGSPDQDLGASHVESLPVLGEPYMDTEDLEHG